MDLTTRRFALSPAELATTALAVVVSSTAYVVAGEPYLARGVVGDLVGLAVLAAVALSARARLRHEALLCLVLIGVVTAAAPQWPLRVPEPVWWSVFAGARAGYLALRRRTCD